ncbi:MAG: hypothetical protein ACM35G_04695 [Planctomycetaceae bacterium]
MGRRLIILLAVGLIVVGYGARRAPAEPDAAPVPSDPTKGADLPPPDPPPTDEAGKGAPAALPDLPATPPEPGKGPGPPATGEELPPPEGPAPIGKQQAKESESPAGRAVPSPRPAGESAAPEAISRPKARLLTDEPIEALPPAPAMPPPAPRDPKVEPAQAPGGIPKAAPATASAPESDPLPPATGAPGVAPKPETGASREDEGFVLRPDQLHPGRQAIGLTVDVIAPPTLNINQSTSLKIVVKNTGTTDVRGVLVRDELPETLAFESSQPEAQRSGALLFWNLSTVPAGTERTILVRVKPTKVGAFDHAATVRMLAGGKSQTIVREPKLKVEQTATTGKVLKGQQVRFKIAIANPGDGPAHDVVVQARLSPGLRHESETGEPTDRDQLFEQTIPEIKAGERVELETLVADTVLGGPQTCLVVAQSPDVTAGSDDAKCVATVTVVEPKLRVAVAGPKSRYTDTLATYTITLENPGTSTARNVQVLATLPVSGQLASLPPGARWNRSTGRLSWAIPQIEPGEKEKVTLSFQVKMGGVGFYQVDVETRAEGGLFEKGSCRTDVTGFADIVFDVSERRRTVDAGDETSFQIKIKNLGTKEATRLLVRAKVTPNLLVKETSGTDQNAHFRSPAERNEIVFPQIDRLGPGKELVLGIKVQAETPGLATCRVYLMYDDMEAEVDDVAYTRVTSINRQ